MRRVIGIALVVLAVTLGVIGALKNYSSAPPQPTVTFIAPTPIFEFFAANTGVQCEVGRTDGKWVTTDYAYCQAESTNHSVSFSVGHPAKLCDPTRSCLGNPGLNTPRLQQGVVVGAGEVTCAIGPQGVTCRDRQGFGFDMTRTFTMPLHP